MILPDSFDIDVVVALSEVEAEFPALSEVKLVGDDGVTQLVDEGRGSAYSFDEDHQMCFCIISIYYGMLYNMYVGRIPIGKRRLFH